MGKSATSGFHERFVAEYLVDLNATQAYLRAHGTCRSANTAAVEGHRLLRKPKIAAAVEAGKARQLEKAELSATRVLEELRRIGTFDPADLFDDDGHLLPIKQIPKEARAAIAGLEVAQANLNRTDGKKDDEYLHKIKLANKNHALEVLAKHFKLIDGRDDAKAGTEDLERRIEEIRVMLAAGVKARKR